MNNWIVDLNQKEQARGTALVFVPMRAEDPMHSDLSHARFAGNFLSTLFAIQVMKIEYRSLS